MCLTCQWSHMNSVFQLCKAYRQSLTDWPIWLWMRIRFLFVFFPKIILQGQWLRWLYWYKVEVICALVTFMYTQTHKLSADSLIHFAFQSFSLSRSLSLSPLPPIKSIHSASISVTSQTVTSFNFSQTPTAVSDPTPLSRSVWILAHFPISMQKENRENGCYFEAW